MPKLSRKSIDMGRVVATKTIKSIFGKSTYNIYEKSVIPWKEGIEEKYVNGYKVRIETKSI